ncbi:MAG: glycosyltransferase [Anaerolineae bacterium]
MPTPLHIAHLTPSLNTTAGGLSRVVLGLARAQMNLGCQVTVHVLESDTPAADFPFRVVQNRPIGPAQIGYSPTLLQQLVDSKPDVIHSHGLWTYTSYASHVASRSLAVPHVCSPHGMLDAWALKQFRAMKTVFSAAFQRRALQQAGCLHALTEAERDSIRAYGVATPTAVVANGIDDALLTVDKVDAKKAFFDRFSHLRGQRIALFLSRIHPKKGLINLLNVWKQLASHTENWHLVIAGPDEGGHEAEIAAEVERLGITSGVSLIGVQQGAEVWECYAAADLFLLPSFSEGFSMAVLEALAFECPVCITTECHFPEVEQVGGGLICEPTHESLAQALSTLLEMSPENRQAMGQRGRALIESRFTWKQVSMQHLAVYHWLRDKSLPIPKFVQS